MITPLPSSWLLHTSEGTTYACPGQMSMQWFAFYDPNNSSKYTLFHSTRDSSYFQKGFEFGNFQPSPTSSNRAIHSSICRVPQDNLDPSRTTTYNSANEYSYKIGLIAGDWLDDAKQYRSWALAPGASQPWVPHDASNNPLRMDQNPGFSSYVLQAHAFASDTPAQCTPNGNSLSVVDPSNFSYWNSYNADRLAFFQVSGLKVCNRFDAWDYDAGDGEWLTGWWLDTTTGTPSVPANFMNALQAVVAADPNHSVAPCFVPVLYDKPIANVLGSYASWPISYAVPSYGIVEDHFLYDETGTPLKSPTSSVLHNFLGCVPQTPDTRQPEYVDFADPFATDYTNYHINKLISSPAGSYARGMYLDVVSLSPLHLTWGANRVPPPFHPETGGGNWYNVAVRNYLSMLKTNATAHGLIGFFLGSESNNEALLDELDFTYCHYRQYNFAHVATTPVVRTTVLPLFDLVYHGFQRTAHFLQLCVKSFGVTNYDAYWFGRANMAYQLYQGKAPYVGCVLDSATGRISDLRSIAPPNEFVPYTDFAKDAVRLQAVSGVRDFLIFGERVRDPVTNALPSDLSAFAPLMFGNYPTVFACAYRRTDLVPNVPQGLILLQNWTKSTDAINHVAAQMPVNVTIDSSAFGLILGRTYSIDYYTSNGTLIHVQSVVFTPGQPAITLPFNVSSLSSIALTIK